MIRSLSLLLMAIARTPAPQNLSHLPVSGQYRHGGSDQACWTCIQDCRCATSFPRTGTAWRSRAAAAACEVGKGEGRGGEEGVTPSHTSPPVPSFPTLPGSRPAAGLPCGSRSQPSTPAPGPQRWGSSLCCASRWRCPAASRGEGGNAEV